MTALSSSLLAPVDPPEWGRAQQWVMAQAIEPLSEADRDQVAQIYLHAQEQHARRVGLHEVTREGRSVLFGLLGQIVYAIEEGQLWGFHLTFAEMTRLIRGRQAGPFLWRAYLAHRARPDVRALHGQWLLRLPPSRRPIHTDRMSMLDPEDWVKKEGEAVLDRAREQGIPMVFLDPYELDAEHQTRHQQHHTAAEKHYRAALGHVFRALRCALPRPVRHALWGNRHKTLAYGELAHWLMKEGVTRIPYRQQALTQQPILLPLALQASGQYPMSFASPAHRHRTILKPQLDRGATLTHAIDQGAPWVPLMVTILQQEKEQAWLLQGYKRWRAPLLKQPGMNLTDALARQVQHSSQVQLPPLHQIGHRVLAAAVWAHAWANLSRPRRPTSSAGQHQLVVFLRKLVDRLRLDRCHHNQVPWQFKPEPQLAQWIGDHLNHFVKGLPEDWRDPRYEALLLRWGNLMDTLQWMVTPISDRTTPTIGTLLARLTWVQWDNFADRAHVIEDALRSDCPVAEGTENLTWPGARRQPVWQTDEVSIHELLDEIALEEEGTAMDHCIAGYGMACASGDSRTFSVRQADGTRLSTLEVTWEEGQVQAVQHMSAGNQAPPAVAAQAVKKFLEDGAGWRPGPWLATEGHRRREAAWSADQARLADYFRELSKRLWAELDRRYPERAPSRAPVSAQC